MEDLHADVAALVDAFDAAKGSAQTIRARAQALVQKGPSSFRRDHMVPGHFTASAVVLSPDERGVLLVLHRKLGIWCQPGGHFEGHDASVEAAALRECAEEVGLVELERAGMGLFDLDIHPIAARSSEPAHHHFDLRLLFRARNPTIGARSEIVDARWFPLAEARGVADDSLRRALARLPGPR